MQRFFVTPVLDRGKQYWLANFPGEKEQWSRRARGRKQKKFISRPAAEAFLAEAQREFIRKGRVSLATDRDLHYDFMRAVELMTEIPGGRLEVAAHMLRMARSSSGRARSATIFGVPERGASAWRNCWRDGERGYNDVVRARSERSSK